MTTITSQDPITPFNLYMLARTGNDKEFEEMFFRALKEAREKAIEECLKLLSDNGVNNYRYDSEGNDWKKLFEKIEQLKSITN